MWKKKETKTGKITFHKYLGGRGKLSDPLLDHLRRYLSSSVKRAKHYPSENAIQMLKQYILATLSHITSTDENPDHALCPVGEKSWCFFQQDIAHDRQTRPHKNMKVKLSVPDDVKRHIKEIYESLTTEELLKRCLKGWTQNLNESFNAKIWKKCPKI